MRLSSQIGRNLSPESSKPSGIGRRILAVARLVEADVEGQAVAQPEEAQVVFEIIQLLRRHPGPEPRLAAGFGFGESASASLSKRRTSVS